MGQQGHLVKKNWTLTLNATDACCRWLEKFSANSSPAPAASAITHLQQWRILSVSAFNIVCLLWNSVLLSSPGQNRGSKTWRRYGRMHITISRGGQNTCYKIKYFESSVLLRVWFSRVVTPTKWRKFTRRKQQSYEKYRFCKEISFLSRPKYIVCTV